MRSGNSWGGGFSSRTAYIVIALWLLAVVLLSTQVVELDKRLVYSESLFLPHDTESFRGLQVLKELGYDVEDSFFIIFSPNDVNSAEAVERLLNETLRDFNVGGYTISGPYTVYRIILGYVEGNLSKIVGEAVKAFDTINEAGLKARKAYENASTVLKEGYGLVDSFLKLYNEARERGIEDPGGYAYENLKTMLPVDRLPLLEGFYGYFKVYENNMDPESAARKAIIDLAKAYRPEIALLLESFDLTNYSNPQAIVLYVYREGGFKAYNISFEDFQKLLENPEAGALSYVKSQLATRIDECAARAFERVLEGFDTRRAVLEECRDYMGRIAAYPNVIPESLRKTLLSNGYGIVYVAFEKSIPVDTSRRITESLDERLKDVIREAYYHGTLTLFADIGVSAEREVRRIDIATAVLVIGLLIVLLGSIASPLTILTVTGTSLVVSLGLLSIAALHTNIYYLARVVMIPIVFGIAVDYSVFYLFRVAEERSRGYGWDEAVYQAWRRAGRALLLGGVAVVLGFLAYALTPQEALRGIGIALSIAAATSFLASYTLLPSLLAILGENRVFWPARSIRFIAARQGALLRRMAGFSIRFPIIVTLIVLVVIGGLALYLISKPPSANIHLALPPYSHFIEASEILYTNFPKDVFSNAYIIAPASVNVEELVDMLKASNLVEDGVKLEENRGYTVIDIRLWVDPLDDRLFNIIPEIRDIVKRFNGDAILSGFTTLRVDAVNMILSDYFTITLPLAITLIILYLMIGIGSIIVPLRLAITVLFSAILSLSATTLAFHYITEAPAYSSYVRSPIYWITPIIVLGLMVTLGMDYDIFISSRIREEYERRGDHDKAILEAVERTGVVITVCGLILAGAFSSLLLTEITVLKQVGFTVALSILVDTFIVRPVIVPAIMSIAGKYNWWPGKGFIRRWD